MQPTLRFPFPITPVEVGGGKLAVFFGIKSGSGASTLACLAAISLAERQDVALVDLNPESKIRTYMGFPPDVSSASILDVNGVSSPESIVGAGEDAYLKNLKVFPGAIRTLDASQISAALHQKACVNLKKVFSYTVAAVGPLYTSAWASLIIADVICIVLNPSRTDMDCYGDHMELLQRLGVSDRCFTIMNKLGYPGALDRKGILAYFKPDVIVDYDRSIAGAGNRRNLVPSREIRNELLRVLIEKDSKKMSGKRKYQWFRRAR